MEKKAQIGNLVKSVFNNPYLYSVYQGLSQVPQVAPIKAPGWYNTAKKYYNTASNLNKQFKLLDNQASIRDFV